MFCPTCRSEYVAGITACPDCGAALVAALPPGPARSCETELDLATILETGNQALLLTVRSILDGAGIPCLVKGEHLQDLFGLGRIGLGYNQVVGPVRVQVRKDQERLARQLLQEIGDPGPDGITDHHA